MITTTNPRTGVTRNVEIEETTPQQLEGLANGAARAARWLEVLGRAGRAQLLEHIAEALESDRAELVRTAREETGLDETRLGGELTRSVTQFQLFAQALREGSYLEATIDHAGDTPQGPGPDIRRMLIPLGPVAVFGASNFPFAFSVAGGDTASALAAGCPTVIKAHDSHPLTSLRSLQVMQGAATAFGAPEGVMSLVFGKDAAGHLIRHPVIKAVSFTGSLPTGQALLEIVNRRAEPIPFYGELSSVNPLIITQKAARTRAAEIASGLFNSYTGSGGQLCTKPGLAFVPNGDDGDQLVDTLLELTSEASGHVLLNSRIRDSFEAISARLVSNGAAVGGRGKADGEGFVVAPTLLTTVAADLTEGLTEECFGPLIVVARYNTVAELEAAFTAIPPSLTATIHAEPDQPDEAVALDELTQALQSRVGRIVYNQYPTGVRVSWAQHHGGPWPSTNSQHTSVGVTAMRRFLRPFAWQNAPTAVLPPELRDDECGIPRRVDGELVLPATEVTR